MTIQFFLRWILITLTMTLVASCNSRMKDVIEQPPVVVPIVKQSKYLALGDSYTIGQSVGPKDRFPIQLSDLLNSDSILIDTTLFIAKTGWRTDDLQRAINHAELDESFDLVSLLIGVNNQYQKRPIGQYELEFLALLNQAITLAGGRNDRVFVLSIPDYGYTPFGQNNQATISAEIDEYNSINRRIAQEAHVKWFNITEISRKGLNNPELVASDQLHPSDQMYRLWVELIGDDVRMLLEK